MPSQRTPDDCACGATYDDFRTGLTFAQVRKMMVTGSTDPKDWRQKRRRSVIGYWRELKIMFWYSEHGGCSEDERG